MRNKKEKSQIVECITHNANRKSSSFVIRVNLFPNLCVFVLLILGFGAQAQAKLIYVDNGAPESGSNWDGVNGHSYTGSPGAGFGYSTLQSGCSAMVTGDVLYLRGGTYTENYGQYTAMQFPFNIDGDSWEEGHYQKIASYPREWAILDASGSGKTCAAGTNYCLHDHSSPDYTDNTFYIDNLILYLPIVILAQ